MNAVSEEMQTADVPVRRVTPLQLFIGFGLIGIVGFGGVMPWVRWLLVEKRRWCSEEEFLNLFALSNFLPGGNVVNIAILIGSRLCGGLGSVAALAGLIGPPSFIVVAIGALYKSYGDLPAVQSMISALASAAAGLVVAMGLRMAYPLRKSPRALVFIGIVIVAAIALRMPLIWMLCLILPASLVAARLMRH